MLQKNAVAPSASPSSTKVLQKQDGRWHYARGAAASDQICQLVIAAVAEKSLRGERETAAVNLLASSTLLALGSGCVIRFHLHTT